MLPDGVIEIKMRCVTPAARAWLSALETGIQCSS
jgi:hypothetical protein